MLNKFKEGLFFGGGFAISFIAIWYLAAYFITPSLTSYSYTSKEPSEISNTRKPKVVEEIQNSNENKEYSFFIDSGRDMEIPHNGGVLYMAKLPTDSSAKYPNTVQLWLTSKELWLIKTTNTNPEIKLISYPKDKARKEAFNILHKYSGYNSGSSSTTISEQTISMLKQGFATERSTMNGKLQITEEGVVFLQPNAYKA